MSLVITADHLARIAGRKTALMPALAEWMNALCPQYEIDTAREYAHFLAQACHETDHFKTLREYASGSAYEGRADLGNSQAGDGVRFRGRGIFQTTGRANYLQLGIKKGRRDLFVNHPELLEQPELAVWSACEYWATRGLNDPANHGDEELLRKKHRGQILQLSPVEFISYTVNGGNRGLEERKAFYASALSILSEAETEAETQTLAGGSRGLPAPRAHKAEKPVKRGNGDQKAGAKKTRALSKR